MQTCLFSSASSATNPPFNEYYNSYSRCAESCSSRSSSPWSDMTSSIQRENDIDMTDSPATSYASFEQLSAESPYSGECEEVSSRHTSGSSASLSAYAPSSSHGIHLHSEPRRKAAKNAYVASKDLESVTRAVRVRELKEKALRINKGGSNKAPCPDLQRDVLRMVFDQITPYPDEAWIAQLALHFNWYANSDSDTGTVCILLKSSLADTTKSKIGFRIIVKKMPVNTGPLIRRVNMTLRRPFGRSIAKAG